MVTLQEAQPDDVRIRETHEHDGLMSCSIDDSGAFGVLWRDCEQWHTSAFAKQAAFPKLDAALTWLLELNRAIWLGPYHD